MIFEGKTLTLSKDDTGIATLIFDRQGEAVNKFDRLAVGELSQALDAIESDSAITGLIVTSGKAVFVVGADIGEFTGLFKEGAEPTKAFLVDNSANFRRLEKLPVPVVAAINGFALGGGFEVCLACDVRVASETAAVGLPETGLGIIPGWGGTVRLPRVAGVDSALEWITSAKQVKALAALEVGAVDSVVAPEALMADAEAALSACIDGETDYLAIRAEKETTSADIAAHAKSVEAEWRAKITKKFGARLPANTHAANAVFGAIELPLDDAVKHEADCFGAVSQTDQAAALVGNFLSDQYLSKLSKQRAKAATSAVNKAAVLGAGIMGGGIAYQSAFTGTPAVMKDIAQAGLDLGMREAESLLNKRVKRGSLSEEKKDAVLAAITPTLTYDESFDGMDIVVEAVVENINVKHAVLTEVEDKVSADAVICSNTSSIPITALAEKLQRPQNFCGMHFFNPVHAMPLVEVIRGAQTSEETINKTVAYAVALKKKPVVVGDCAGFLVNRLLFAYFAAFSKLLNDGADYEQVDKVMEQWGWPMGPAYLADVIGLDTMQHVDDVISAAYPARLQQDFPSWYQVLLDMDLLGQKNGSGFYSYTKVDGRPHKAVNAEAKNRLAELTKPAAEFTELEIVERLMVPFGIEMALALEESVVASPAEGDLALLYGIGFPNFRGGLARWMDAVGMADFVAMADKHAAEHGALYQVTARQREMAQQGQSYYD